MAQLEFVDTYLHIMDPFNPDFPVPWFQPEATHAHLGEHLERLNRDFPFQTASTPIDGATVME